MVNDMSTIYDQITEGMKTAMRAKDTVALSALRGLKTALQNAQVAKGSVHDALPENEAQNVVRPGSLALSGLPRLEW